MGTNLEFNVFSTDSTKFSFIPAKLTANIGAVNEDLKTVNVSFELKDEQPFDEQLYVSLERIQRGTMKLPIEYVSQLTNEDGSLNINVINQILAPSYLAV